MVIKLAWRLLKRVVKRRKKNEAACGRKKETMICVEGIVIPANWDNKGNVVGLAIATRNEVEYLINDKKYVARLKPLLRQEVAIRGILGTKEGKVIIKVKEFSKLKKKSSASKIRH
ncbi:MAG: hypothetical protein PVI71_07065 [Desulfobacterales bacterium]|jgi:hypothetical protein